MEYEVQELDQDINGHDIRIRLLNPVLGEVMESEDVEHDCEHEPQAYIYIECKSCYMVTDFDPHGAFVTEDDMRLVSMEANLHAEGFDTEWEPGELEDLGHYRGQD